MEFHLPYQLLIVTIFYSLIVRYLTFGADIPSAFPLVISLALIAAGILIGIQVKEIIRKHKTTLNPYGAPTTLVTSGPFKFSRNPMYVSYLLVAVGFTAYSGAWIGLLGPILYFLYLNFKVIPQEERALMESFLESYKIYTDKVRRWL